MSLDPPPYILSLQNNIRARPVSWEGAVRAKTITDAELKKIKSIDKVRKEQRRQTIESDKEGFGKLWLGGDGVQSIFTSAAKRQDIIQYLLVLLGDIVDDNPEFVETLVRRDDPYQPLLPFLQQSSNPEEPIPLLTSAVLSSLISHALISSAFRRIQPQAKSAIPKLNSYLSSLVQSADSGLQDIAVQQYSAILRSSPARELFWEQRKETLNPLIDIIRAGGGTRDTESTLYNGGSTRSTNSIRSMASDVNLSGGVSIQLMYHVLLVLWQLSFEGERVGPGLDEEHDIIPLLTQTLRVSPKEKITRLIVATLNNLLSSNKDTLLPAAMQARLQQLVSNIKGRKVLDNDLQEDLDNLKDMLEDYSKSQTTFDQYAAEVRSGHLRWSPPHRNPEFWKENARKIFEENKGELAKQLAEILSKEWQNDKQVLAIGCNDVAWLVKEVPEKKSQLEKLGLKLRVMSLMKSDDESVRWESLRAVGEWLRYSFDG